MNPLLYKNNILAIEIDRSDWLNTSNHFLTQYVGASFLYEFLLCTLGKTTKVPFNYHHNTN